MLPFVDPHIHLWDLSRFRYPWLTGPFDDSGPNGSTEAIARTFLVAEYRAALARWTVRGCVHIDAGAAPEQALDETRWLEAVAEETGLPNGIVAYTPLDDPEVDALLEAQSAHPRVRGIRQIVNWHPDPRRTYTGRDLTRDGDWQRGFGRLSRYGLSFDLQCYPEQMVSIAPLLARHRDVSVILNHLGMPLIDEPEGMDRWRGGLRALAALPQVSIKLSGLGFIRRDWTRELVTPLLHEAIEIFGTKRCMFASDVPTDTLFAPIDTYLETYHAVAAAYSPDEQRDLFARNADRIYRLGLGRSLDDDPGDA